MSTTPIRPFLWLALTLGFLTSACVSFPEAPLATHEPKLNDATITSFDGASLGLMTWRAESPRAVIVAFHGMNDYSNAFALPGAWWAQNAGLTTYAIDIRGFGRSPDVGLWPGDEAIIKDTHAAIAAVREAHPKLPIYIMGHSMGAAVTMVSELDRTLDADGMVLVSPGIWGGRAMPFPYRVSLNVAASFAPGKTLTGERAERQSTDNIDLLRKMYHDPLVIKETRMDTILGAVRLMGDAYNDADEISGNILFLIGEKDEIIPIEAMEKTAARFGGDVDIIRYEDGWHLLLRDLQGENVWRDIADWIVAQDIALK